MAGVTNAPFRALCREFGPGLVYVNEMVMATALVHGNARTQRMVTFAPDESPRSLQLYGSDPVMMGEAAARLADNGIVDHIDINFGCPAAKVTRRGGGAAVPLKRNLLRAILRETVRNAKGIPVTCKFRMGVNDDLITYLDTGTIAAEEGVAWVALHARTAEQHYAGLARWDAIAQLKRHVPDMQVLGNGDVWDARDALRMIEHTGCDGVVVGRGCLGRPWLFRDLVDAFSTSCSAMRDRSSTSPSPARAFVNSANTRAGTSPDIPSVGKCAAVPHRPTRSNNWKSCLPVSTAT
jgi:nifR3 family TIM-barrel protein